MVDFIAENLSTFWSILCTVIAVVCAVLTFIFKRSKKAGQLAPVADLFTKISKMLPGLITFSETINSGKSGEAKKEYVITYIKQTFAMMGAELNEATLADISELIDDIVKATKQMHTSTSSIVKVVK